MTNELTTTDKPFALTPRGMEVHGTPTIEDWILFGRELYDIRSAVLWAVGDWINYGESRVDWGEKYDQALGDFEYDYGYLRNLSSIARQFPSSRRRVTLSWSHHQAVAALPEPEQTVLLDRAERERISRDDLRDLAQQRNPKDKPPKPVTLLEPTGFTIARASEEMMLVSLQFDRTADGAAAVRQFVNLWRHEERNLRLTVTQTADPFDRPLSVVALAAGRGV